jgi:hypothetical protein
VMKGFILVGSREGPPVWVNVSNILTIRGGEKGCTILLGPGCWVDTLTSVNDVCEAIDRLNEDEE